MPELRNYKLEDLEALRKYFRVTQDKIANDLHIARTTVSAVINGKLDEQRTRHYATVFGMYWEIFAINYVRSYRVSKSCGTYDCYGYLLGYVIDMRKLPKLDQINFSEWYIRVVCEEG